MTNSSPPASAPLDRLWTPADLSEYLGVPVGTIYQWSSRRIGPRARKVGRHLRYRPADVEAWLAAQGDPAA